MVREFSEEKRQEIFRLLDEIDNREWKSFMEWCGSSAEEFGDWPDKLAVSAYTRYVDEYHQKVLETNEMTRNRVNTVFENVAEIDTRYAGRMKECQIKIKEQIATVKTMTEFMQSMTDGNSNMALLSKGSVNENCVRMEDDDEDEEENTEIPVVIDAGEAFFPGYTERGQQILTQCLIDHNITDSDEINRVLEWTMENDSWKFIELTQASQGDIINVTVEEIFKTIMRNYYANTATEEDSNENSIDIDCYEIRSSLSLEKCGMEDFEDTINELYKNGFVSEKDYINIYNLMKAVSDTSLDYLIRDVLREKLEEHLNHVVTTVYIYNCLQVIANREITPEECCKVNDIFRLFGITDRNSIACLLICCAGESDGFLYTQEIYDPDSDYLREERGAGYLQVTGKDLQLVCLHYIYDLYGIKFKHDTNKLGYSNEVAMYPWEASAWYWAILLKVGINDKEPLNSYVMKRLKDNGGKLTLGIVLTAECFVNGVEDSTWNTYGDYSIDDALRLIARFDSLRMNDNNGGWQVTSEETVDGIVWKLKIPAEILAEITVSTPASDIPSKWDTSSCLEFRAPNNWDKYEGYYDALQEAGLLDFDLNTELP